MKNKIVAFKEKFHLALLRFVDDEASRIRLQNIAIYGVLGLISAVMTVLNAITDKKLLMIATLVFSVLNVVNVLLTLKSKKGLDLASILFRVEMLVLFTFFIVSGTPEGFSATWAALLPACGLLMFQMKQGTILSAIMFGIIVFFFWTPVGQSFLQYNYTESFRLRFPFLYVAFFGVGLFLETIRSATFENYAFMCTHDPLTGALNRRGFSEEIAHDFATSAEPEVGFIIFDLDRFKRINDTYGHFTGDEVLKETFKRISDLTGLPVCRWGGEEFAVFVPDGRLTQEMVTGFADEFRRELVTVDDLSLPITISLGAVTTKRFPGLKPDSLGIEADACLYEAKETGRAKGVFRRVDIPAVPTKNPSEK